MTHTAEKFSDTFSAQLRTFDDIEVKSGIPLASLTTMGVGGPVLAAIDVKSAAALQQILILLQTFDIPWKIIGRGSNIVAGDDGWQGCVIRLSGEFLAIVADEEDNSAENDDVMITAGAGIMLPSLFSWCLKHAIQGVEFLAGIPGTVGGAVAMNAGAWGSETADLLEKITILLPDGTITTIGRNNLSFSYRKWHGPEGAIVLQAFFRLKKGEKAKIRAKCQELLDHRRLCQPLSFASSGSFFKNPTGMSAGQLIDTAGLKGLKRGGAMVSWEHGNFIINTGCASADDIISLMREIQEKVYQHFQVSLEPEVHFLACSLPQKEMA